MIANYSKNLFAAVFATFLASSFSVAQAEVRMPAVFGDHMVLQREIKIPVWGWAKPGEKITATFKNKLKRPLLARMGNGGLIWIRLILDNQPGTLVAAGVDNTLTFTDVLVGDVWVVSGQSNMEFGIQNDSRGKDAIANATDSQIRFFFVPWQNGVAAADRR